MCFVLRNSRTFTDEYCTARLSGPSWSLVWNPALKKHSDALKKIQCRFLGYIYLRIFQYYPTDVTDTELLRSFQMESLENRRNIAEVNSLHNILQGRTDSTLLEEINLRIPRPNARLEETFNTHHLQKIPTQT